ncbi:uncharacterized protein LOC103484301 [Cucumis melo]|uniref:Uncharacterized protein LOC103484301 n=1 Tax=Cucumis melo TaxID=3656 RepID=A0A1S3AYK4_CUCME|nr:uncharacterized protein LOC103484301 [Cucumis melo]
MPLPWKKTKPNRISRIVADLQPPSRATSLVVETGFPTSVVDLFVKNRDRIKRHSLRKPKHKQHSTHVSESLAPPPTPSLSPDNSPRLPEHEDVVVTASCSTAGRKVDGLQHRPIPADVQLNVVSARPNFCSNADADADGVCLNSMSMVFVAAVKMLLVVIPVLSTQKLVLGITISAFLLFLLEIFGKFAVCNLLNRSLIRNWFVPTTVKSCGVGLNYRGVGGGGEEEDAVATNSGLNNAIQIVESYSEDEGLCLERESLGNREKGFVGCSDLEVEKEEQGNLQVGKNEISRSAKLRAKIIKKLIPKKLRSGKRVKRSKKEKKIMKQEMGITINENEQETESSGEEEDEEVWEEEEEDIGPSTTRKGKDKEDGDDEEEEEEGKKSFECDIVIVTILLGLCGGRFLAFVLTVSGCFMFKFIKILTHKWRFE